MKRFSSLMRPEPQNIDHICDEVTDCLRTWGEDPAVVARTRCVVTELLARTDPARAMRFDLAHRPGRVDLRVTQSETVRRTDAAAVPAG